ncbi:MAG: 50S ribosomal protein L13 [Euryarchaeota archaeon]|nr:50S ribosomal protein L13 [Euryarchaeota archaeon]
MAIINAEGHILGRLCTNIAERILNGEEIVVVNAEKALVTGKKEMVFGEFKQKKDRGKIIRGPFYPRRADLIFKRTVRGMIPYDRPSGRAAYRRLKIYVGVPNEYSASAMEKVEEAIRPISSKYVTLSDISAHLGSKVR